MSNKHTQGWYGKMKNWWDNDDDDGVSWTSRYSFNKEKTNIVDPELDWLTKSDLRWGLDNHVRTLPENLRNLYQKDAIPKEVIEDIFKSYSYSPEEIALINLEKPELKWKADLLDKVSNYYLKTITRGNDLYSTIVTRHITGALLKLLQDFQDKQDANGGGGGGKATLEQMLASMSPGDLDRAMNAAQDAATDQIQAVEGQLGEMLGGKEAGKMATDIKTLEVLAEIESFTKLINVRPEQISKFIKGCYKRIVSYYNASSKVYEEPFLESDDIADFDDLIELLPIFRNANLEDLVIKGYKSNFMFDLYIDGSGSMDEQVTIGDRKVNLYNLCRYLAIKLYSLGLVKNIYVFETHLTKMDNVFHLMRYGHGGGTHFDCVLDNISKTNMSSVILTDMCDNISRYTKGAYFIGMKTFRPQGTTDIIGSYAREKQFMLYTGAEFKVPIKGKDY